MSAIDELKEAIEYACAYNESLIHLSTRTAQAILAALTWTPVEEGLPEMPKGDICTSAVVEVCNVKSKCFCEGYYDFGGEFWECEIEPTHWRYVILPKPRPCRACDKAGVTCLREIIEPKSCEACRGSGKVEKTCKECGKIRDENCFSVCPTKLCPACGKSEHIPSRFFSECGTDALPPHEEQATTNMPKFCAKCSGEVVLVEKDGYIVCPTCGYSYGECCGKEKKDEV